jgi:tRNA(Ile)-lysidine synthase TilS/MesJ
LRGSLPSGKKVGFDVSTLGGRVAEHVIKPFAEKARNECVQVKSSEEAGELGLDLLVLGDTLDDDLVDFMTGVVGWKNREREKQEVTCCKTVKPLANCSEKEVLAYAGFKGIDGKKVLASEGGKLVKEKRVLKRELDKMEEKHPGTKFALRNSFKKMEQL